MSLFKSVDISDLERILEDLNVSETRFKKNEILAMQDEPCNRRIILQSGSVKAEMTSPAGQIAKVEDIKAPNPLAILFLFGDDNHFPVEVTALEDISALVIPKQSVLKMLGRNETLLKNYLDISADYATKLSKKLNFVTLRTIRQKLAMYLLDLANKQQSNVVELDKSKRALAEYFGVTRPALERELARMQEDNIISNNRREITIENKYRLKELVNFESFFFDSTKPVLLVF